MAVSGPDIWLQGHFRLFISHTHGYQVQAADFRSGLGRFAISGFVAHDSIQPTQPWEEVIRSALTSCGALAALISPDAASSDWVDQETGWALGRNALVIPVTIGTSPYGFIARYQAINAEGKSWNNIAELVCSSLLKDPRTVGGMSDALVSFFADSDSFAEASRRFSLLEQVPVLTAQQLDTVEGAAKSNSQNRDSYYVKDRLGWFLEQRRALLKPPTEQA